MLLELIFLFFFSSSLDWNVSKVALESTTHLLAYLLAFIFFFFFFFCLTEAILVWSRRTPYFRLLFIAIERGVLSILAEYFTHLCGILSKPAPVLELIPFRRFWNRKGLVDSERNDIDLGVFDVVIELLICFSLGWFWYVRIISLITEKSSLDLFVIFNGLKPPFIYTLLI